MIQLVPDLRSLQLYASKFDAENLQSLYYLEDTHPEVPFFELDLAIATNEDGTVPKAGNCPNCKEPQVFCQNKKTLEPIGVCRSVINALRMVSLNHRNQAVMCCISCEIYMDRLGFVLGACHKESYLKDQGNIVGLETFFKLGPVYLDLEKQNLITGEKSDSHAAKLS